MKAPHLTKHASKRCQERSIPEVMVALMSYYGEEEYQKGGSSLIRLSAHSKRLLRKEIKQLYKRWDSLEDSYIVESENGEIITVAHRHR